MESKRLLRGSIPRRHSHAFNRTSMESKRRCLNLWKWYLPMLLIEPVWNRNGIGPKTFADVLPYPFNRTSMESKRKKCWAAVNSKHTFNRTSMESKLFLYEKDFIVHGTFNRTSMESKQRNRECKSVSLDLLIEPVWNRNTHYRWRMRCWIQLLIEPVWNRNLSIFFTGLRLFSSLLIEPVWNRNVSFSSSSHTTSILLIEPVWNRNQSVHGSKKRLQSALLIEPVWNRNLHLQPRTQLCNSPFNRTSMESKLLRTRLES